MKSVLITTGLVFCLSGCVVDPITNETIPDRERAVMKTLANRIPKACALVKLDPNTSQTVEGSERKSYKNFAEIRRFYLSDGDWFRVTVLLDGVWDEVYFNKTTDQLVCGEQAWKKFVDSGSIKFYEYGTTPPPRLSPVSGATGTEAGVLTAIGRFRDSLRPQLVYERDADVCDDLRLVSEVGNRMLKGHDFQQIAREMSQSATVGTAGVNNKIADFSLRLMKAGEMADKLAVDKKLTIAVYQQCGQR